MPLLRQPFGASAITGKERRGIVNEALEAWFADYEKGTKTVIPVR